MKTEYYYYIEHGDVWYRGAGTPNHVCGANENLGIAYSDDVLFKAGSELSIQKWLEKKAGNTGGFEIDTVFFPVSPATVTELNLCITHSGRVQFILENLNRIGDEDPSLHKRIQYPN